MIPLTPTERRIVDVLLDGDPHPNEHLLAVIDEQADDKCLAAHLTNIRKKIQPTGHDIIPVRNGRPGNRTYKLVRLLRPDHI